MIKQATAGLIALGALSAGVDATTLNVPPVAFDSVIKENRVQVVERENVVEATMPWKDQPGLKVKYDMGEPTVSENVKDKRKQQVITETINTQEVELKRKKDQLTKYKADIETYGTSSVQIDGLVIAATSTEESIKIAEQQISSIDEDLIVQDGLKIDIILTEKPATTTFCYQIEGWEDYDFFYQPPLTPEEIAEGAERPEEIVGSYAVYHKTLRNHVIGKTNHEAGKIAHIPYPYVWSVNATSSTKHRAEAFSIENGNMCVTTAQSDLDTMEYPIRVDPTFGYTSVGASSQSLFNDALGTRYTVPTDYSSLTNYSVYLKTGSNGGLKVIVTNTSRSIITDGVSDAKSTGAIGWQTVTDGSPPTLTPSSDYFFHAIDNNGRGIAYDTGGTSNYGNTDTTNDYTTPSNPSDGTLSDRRYSIYATYTASGGGGTSSTNSGVLIFE